jgi:hypothetical protein
MLPQLSEPDLQKPRTQAELRAWVDDLHRQFRSTAEGKRAVRLNKGNLIKKFTEEAWPLALFADAYYKDRADLLFQLVPGYESYDARIMEASGGHTLHHLQITQSFDGYQNHLRMLHLDKYGRAPVTGPKLQKNKRTGSVQETWPAAVRHDKALEENFERIQCAVERKSRMRYEADTSLIVQFEDNYIHSESDCAALDYFARSTLVPRAVHFVALYLVSDHERLAYRYEIGAAAS